jgi:hypothetical protein
MSDVLRRTPEERLGEPRPTATEAALRQVAIGRLKKQRDFWRHCFTYAVVNVGLWVVWFVAGVTDAWAFPWPLFPTVFWGLFLLAHARDVFWHDPLREERVQREIEQLRESSQADPLDTYDVD